MRFSSRSRPSRRRALRRGELVELAARHEQSLLFDRVLDEALGEAARRVGVPGRDARAPCRRAGARRRRRPRPASSSSTSQRRWRTRNITSLASSALPATSTARSRCSSPFAAAASASGPSVITSEAARAGRRGDQPPVGERSAKRSAGSGGARSSSVSPANGAQALARPGLGFEQGVQGRGERRFESFMARKNKGHPEVAFRCRARAGD